MPIRLLVAVILGLVLGVILACTIIPVFSMLQMPASIGGSELAPLMTVVGLIVIALAWRPAAGHRHLRRFTLGLGLGAVLVTAITLIKVPAAWATTDAAMTQGLQRISPGKTTAARMPFLDPLALLTGIRTPAVHVDRGVEIGTSGGVVLLADIFHPTPGGRHPLVLAIHGGGWSSGTRSEGETIHRALAAAGIVVVSADYRLAPGCHFPAQLTDVQVALAWLRTHATDIGGDPQRIGIMGRSAGAQLAVLAAAAPDSGISAVIGLYSPVDFTAGWRDPGWPDPLDARSVFRDYFGGSLDDLPDIYRTASPITAAAQRLPPTLLIYGERDHLIDLRFGQLLAERLRRSGTPTVLLTLPWSDHAFDAIPHGLGGQLALRQIERFLNGVLASP